MGRYRGQALVAAALAAALSCAPAPPTETELHRMLADSGEALSDLIVATEPADLIAPVGGDGLVRLGPRSAGHPDESCLVDPDGAGSGRRSLLWPETITGLEHRPEGDRVEGSVAFARPGCFAGRLPFTVARHGHGWRLESLTLPAAGRRAVADGDGWRLEPATERPPPPDLRCRRLPAPLHLRLEADPLPFLEADGVPVTAPELALAAAGRNLEIQSHEAAPYSLLVEALTTMTTAEIPPHALGFVTPMLVDCCWHILDPPPPEVSYLDQRRAWVTTSRRVLRGELGPSARPRLRLDAEATVLAVDRVETIDLRALVQRFSDLFAADPEAVLVLDPAPHTPLGRVDRVLDAVRAAGGRRVLLLSDGLGGVLLQMKDITWQSPRQDRALPRSIPAPTPPPPTPRPGVKATPRSIATATPIGRHRFVVGGEISEPRRLEGPDPSYPAAALRARIQGVVVLELVIATDGRVTEVKELRGLPLGLTEAAVEAVRQWHWTPATLAGRPVEVVYIVTVRFSLDESSGSGGRQPGRLHQ